MEIMKCSIKRKNKILKINRLRSALFIMSAFAVFIPTVKGAEKEVPPTGVKENVATSDTVFTARSVFEKLQISALEILPPSIRLDMLDYWDVDSVYKASNVMEGLSWLESVTPDYLKVRISPVSNLEIKILPTKKGKIAMTIYTVGDDVQAQDSQVNFYNNALVEEPAEKFLVMPKVKDFFEIPKGSTTKMKEIEEMIPFPTIAFSANLENTNLEAKLTVEQYINQDDWNIAKLFVKPGITLVWKKDKYKLP